MSAISFGHVASDRIGQAAQHASVEFLRADEQRHIGSCGRCKDLYEGYRLADRLLASGWRQASIPVATLDALDERPHGDRLAGLVEGAAAAFGSRVFVPVALAACLSIVVGFGVLLPMLVPSAPAASASHPLPTESRPSVPATPTSGATSTAISDESPAPTPTGKPGGAPPAATPAPTPHATATSVAGASIAVTPLAVTSIGGWPVAWAPDGGHFMIAGGTGWTRSRQVLISDSSGRSTGSFTADSAVWLDSTRIAATTHSPTAGPGSHGPGPGATTHATISLIDVRGRVIGTVPGNSSVGGAAFGGATLLGSGTGYLAIATQGNWGLVESSFVLWDGTRTGSPHAGVPIAFSRDGREIAVMHPSGPSGGTSGWLELVSSPGLATLASFTHTTVRVTASGDGPGYEPDVQFSPDGQSLLVSGVLVDLSRGSAKQVGDGGWLGDGTLVTSGKGGVVLRWQGGNSITDGRFAAGGSIDVSRRGDVVEYFADGRPPMLLKSDGTLEQLHLNGIVSIDGLSLAPHGGALAATGRAPDGSQVTAVALLP